MDFRFEPRDPARRLQGLLVVVALHALLGYALFSGMARKGLNLIRKPLEAVVIQEVLLPPPPPPPPREIRPPQPLAPRSDMAPPPLQLDVPPPPVISPVELTQRDAPLPPKPAAIVIASPAATATTPDNLKLHAASMESEYASMVRAMLNSIKRYPTGRAASQQRPQGKVKVWFTLARSGALLDAGILESSNSNLLDDAAIATVRRGSYPPFPGNTWVDQESHKFSADMQFSPPSS
jgi:protein TonB